MYSRDILGNFSVRISDPFQFLSIYIGINITKETKKYV